MQISDILASGSVKVFAGCSSKKRLFHDLGELAAGPLGLVGEDVAMALMEREALGPTGVGHGVALPHARMSGVEKVCGVFARFEKPLDFKAADRQPVDLVFALFAPLDAGVAHLKALALVSRTLREQSVRDKLRANSDPATLYTVLTAEAITKAA